ncbi:MAG TPA: PH domain-containing protein [Marmoricola sp.]|nr:PH domain-containing protein [Marmoricola sp.]
MSEDAVTSELEHDAAWRRLDMRMLLVHPVNEVVRFLPLLIGLFLFGASDHSDPWHYLGVALPIAIGLLRFASTSFRITGSQIELRRGIIGRSVLTAPLDRVRTVELTAKPIHRLLRLSRVEIGTGSAATSGEGRLVLDSLGAGEARRLREDLLHRAPLPSPGDPVAASGVPAPPESVILRLDPAWVRYAPLTTSGLVIALAALAGASQFLGNLVRAALDASSLDEDVRALPLAVSLPLGVVLFAIVISVLAICGYLLTNWGFMLSRDEAAQTFHVRRGLLTTRETSIDTGRLRGVEIHEPLGLRLAGGGRLTAIVTGFKRRGNDSKTPMVPAAPRAVVAAVGDAVLAENGPLHTALIQHGPIARRRRYVRAVIPTTLIPVLLAVLATTASWPWWLAGVGLLAPALGVLLARDRYARLGHALTTDYVVMRWGSLHGRRDALQRTGIIGWNIKQTFFQRRAGVVSLTATTAAGQQSYEMLDVPEGMAVAFAIEAVPGLVEQFATRLSNAPQSADPALKCT